MLTRIYIDNDRCFSNFEWKPGKLVLLAGRNGAGKSSFLNIIDNIVGVLHGDPVPLLFANRDRTRWDNRTVQTYEIELSSGSVQYTYRVVVDHGPPSNRPSITEETLRTPEHTLLEFKAGEGRLFRDDGSEVTKVIADGARSVVHLVPDRADNRLLTRFKEAVSGFWRLALLPPLFKPESSEEALGPDMRMENFVSWYRSASEDSIKTGQLIAHLSKVLDGLLGLKLERSGRTARLLQAVFSDQEPSGRTGGSTTYDLDELSDGQRALIALYSLLVFGPLDDGLLCIDEPDNFIALAEIEPWLRALEDRLDEGNGQVFLVSHNPEVINRLWQGHGVIFEREPRGPVRVRPMDESTGLLPAEVMARGLVMARTARYVVVAEDRAGLRFVEQYLMSRGIDSRAIRSEHSPPGRGSGKQWVTATYAVEVRAFRAKKNHLWKTLLVVTDADELRVADRNDQLAKSLADAGLAPRGAMERIVLVVPKWEIETWAEHLLRNTKVTEDAKMGWPVDRSERDCHAAGGMLLAHRGIPQPPPGCCPPSLQASDGELARIDRD